MDLKNETYELLNKYNVNINKNLGQNFLVDEKVVKSIIKSAEIEKEDLIIEIGPGLGTLTKELLKNSNNVIAIELDSNMVSIIKERFKEFSNLKIVNEDILKIDLYKLIQDNKNNGKIKIVANLPYYISTPIIIKLLEEKLNIDDIIIMVQKEVAQRIISNPGSKLCGSITYLVDYYAKPLKVIDVGKDCFIPEPKVDSEVIKLNIRVEPKIKAKNEKLLFDIIRKCFTQRRKTLINVLWNFGFVKDKNEAISIVEKLRLNQNVRAETLTLEQFEQIVNKIELNTTREKKNY